MSADTIPVALEYRHSGDRPSSHCKRQGKRSDYGTRKGNPACKVCGMRVHGPYRVTFAVLEWRGDGRYRLADAIGTYARESAAEAAAVAAGPQYVVRTLELE